MSNALPATVTPEFEAAIRRRAHALGIKGNVGGWITIGRKNLQGWWAVADFVLARANKLDENLREIVDGRRVGTPTLSTDCTSEMVAALASTCTVSLRTTTL
jgi:hypothetical protein